MDNHPSHKSYYVRDYLRYKRLEVIFTPPYSSPLNSCVFVWGMFKRRFAKEFSKISTRYNFANFEQDVKEVMNKVNRESITCAMLHANEKAI